MRKKQIFFIALFAIVFMGFNSIDAFASENSSYEENAIDYGKSLTEYEYFEGIQALEEEMMDSLTNLYLSEYPTENQKIPDDFPTINYEDAIKVYVNTNIQNLNTADEEAIEELLSVSNYVWVLPLEYKGVNMQITLSRGNPLNEELVGILTEEEREIIENRAGQWGVTVTSVGRPKNYKQQIADLGIPYDRVIFVGGIPGVQYPLALVFKDGLAEAFIGIGYLQGVLENAAVTYSGDNENPIYDYNGAIQQMKSYREPLVRSGGGPGGSTAIDKPFLIFVIGSVVFFGIVVYLSFKEDFMRNK